MDSFLSDERRDKPMLFEVFTDTKAESSALETILNMVVDTKAKYKDNIRNIVKNVVGDKGIDAIKKVIR